MQVSESVADAPLSPRHFFVDEAGDGTLFDKNGKSLVGTNGCSLFFIIGAIELTQPERLGRELEDLRAELINDPYFKRVPSMQLAAGKTARLFHAKDDLPEVRREVYSLLRKHDIKFYAAVRNKRLIEKSVNYRNREEAAYRYHPNELYDWTVKRVFFGLLDAGQTYSVVFSSRGKSDRTKALTEALQGVPLNVDVAPSQQRPVITVQATDSDKSPELQATDYLLWSLQRFYELREERYLELMWPHYRSVCYMHPKPPQKQGYIYYTQKEPLNLAALDNLIIKTPEI